MESKKCPNCGKELKIIKEGSSLIYECDSCDYSEATTIAEGIGWDSNKFEVKLIPNHNCELNQIKLLSKITGKNFIQSKYLLTNGGTILKDRPSVLVDYLTDFKKAKITFVIEPEFPYEY